MLLPPSAAPAQVPARAPHPAPRRYLAPLKRAADSAAAVAFMAALNDAAASVVFMHVDAAFDRDASATTAAPQAAAVMAEAGQRARACALRFDSFIIGGEVVFAILDTAEMLGCEAILVPQEKARGWRHFFQPTVRDQLDKLARHIPLMYLDAQGALVGRRLP